GIAIDPHQQITFRTLLEEGVWQRDQVLQKTERHLGVEMRAEIEEEMRPNERGQAVKHHHGQQADTNYAEELIVAVWDHTIHEHACQHGHGECEKLQEQREDTEAHYES